jgi:hypothetical protein
MVWLQGDRPGAPSLLIEYEAAKRPPLVTRDVLDGIAYAALWPTETMTVCVVVSPDAEARVVRNVAALPNSAEFRAVKMEFPDGAVTVRVIARRTAVTSSVLSGPALLEMTL